MPTLTKKSKRAVPSRDDHEALEKLPAKLAGLSKFQDANNDPKRLAEYGAAIAAAVKEVREIPLDQVVDDGHNHRLTGKDVSPEHAKRQQAKVQDLADSIKSVGQLQPIRVYTGLDGKFHRVFGARRCAAAALLGLKTIRAEVLGSIPTPPEIQAQRAVENLMRDDLSPAEEALAAQQLVDAEMIAGKMRDQAMEAAANRLGRELSWVKKKIYIVDRLTPKVRQLLAGGKISLTQAEALMKVSGKKQEDFARQVAESLEPREGYGGAWGGKVTSAAEIAGWIVNDQKSLRFVPWHLDVEMRTGVDGCSKCIGCAHNTASDKLLFDDAQDGDNAAGFCRLKEGFEAKQRMTQKLMEKTAEKLESQVKSKKIEKAEAGSMAEVEVAIGPVNFVKPASVQRFVKKELGIGASPVASKNAGKKPQPEMDPHKKARVAWEQAMRAWKDDASEALVKAINADEWKKVGAALLEFCAFPHAACRVPDYEYGGRKTAPVEKPIGPKEAALLQLVTDVVCGGREAMAAIQEIATRIKIDDQSYGVISEIKSWGTVGPELAARVCACFGVTLPAPPPFPAETAEAQKAKK